MTKFLAGLLIVSWMVQGAETDVTCTVEKINSDPATAMKCDGKEVTHSGMFLSTNEIGMGRVVVLGYDHKVNGKDEMGNYNGILSDDAESPNFQVGERVTMTCTVKGGLFEDCTVH
jgi:hypothetical protein